jgi:hypothetical protein
MLVTTEEAFERLMRSRSMILNRPPNDPKRPPKFLAMYDFSPDGLKQMLWERTNKSTGTLVFAREGVKQLLREWDAFNEAQFRRLPRPVGAFAERLNRARAKVKVLEAESRELNRLLDAANAASVAEVKRRFKPRGIMKMRGGVLASVDGREVTDADGGRLVFRDDGADVSEYLAALGEAAKERAAAKEKADRERQARLSAARGNGSKQPTA